MMHKIIMKKIALGLLLLFLSVGSLLAQSLLEKIEQAADFSKEANKALGSFNLDQANNESKLFEARTSIDQATVLVDQITIDDLKGAISKEKDLAKAKKKLSNIYFRKGAVYGDISIKLAALKQIGTVPEELTSISSPAIKSAKAYEKALIFATKKYQSRDAVAGLQAAQGSLNNIALFAFEDKDYPAAYQNFAQNLKVHDLIIAQGAKSTLNETQAYNDQMYYAALAALNGKMEKDAVGLFEKLYAVNYDNSLVYDGLYRINSADGDLEGAYKYLEAGRQKYPEDVSLLFAEINHFLRLNQLDQLIDKLKAAIAAEPENVSLYSTLGNVYDNLYQRESEAGNMTKAQEYFDSAYDYYNKALEKDKTFFDAIYSIGALYYNKAAVLTKKLQALGTSKEDLKKFDVLKKEVFEEFEKALPYFKRCEQLNPADVNTLIALKEIFAKKDDFETSKVFKERLAKVKAGEQIIDSYFK
jgi:tetratricopeptide (TPR) repeat protein